MAAGRRNADIVDPRTALAQPRATAVSASPTVGPTRRSRTSCRGITKPEWHRLPACTGHDEEHGNPPRRAPPLDATRETRILSGIQAPLTVQGAVALLRYGRMGTDHGLNIAGHAPQIDGQS